MSKPHHPSTVRVPTTAPLDELQALVPRQQQQDKETAVVESDHLTPAEILQRDGVTPGPILIEIAWEVARKVGGIYTVIRTKVPYVTSKWGTRYGLVGVYNPESAATEFEARTPTPLSARVLEAMESKYQVKVHYGRWLVPGYPRVFLFDLHSSEHLLHQWRQELMPSFSAPNDKETNDAIIFGHQVAWLIEEFAQHRRVIAHFHEWLVGVALILLTRRQISNISTVFTTHATLVGRYMCAGRVDLYNQLSGLDVDREAGERGIYHRYWIEKEAAHLATVFSTVSEITSYEAQHLLHRTVDVILPNGLNVEKFTALHEFQNLHARYKERINTFVRGHFYGYLDFDLDKTLYFFTSGRHEYFNKGVNLFLDALAQLNEYLRREGSDITVVAFIIMPAPTNNFNVESLKGHSIIRDLKETCQSLVEQLANQVFEDALRGNITTTLTVPKEAEIMLKRRIMAIKSRPCLPPITTHNMMDDSDEILTHLRGVRLWNQPEDRVKVIYHPEFLSSTSAILPLEYNEFVRACHLGVFPSYYEPWGYTPAECTVMGVPSVTSNLTGFSNFISKRVVDPAADGIFVVDRRYRSYSESVKQMSDIMWRFTQLSRRERIELRNKTEKLSDILDWKNLEKYYTQAHELAFKRSFDQALEFDDITQSFA